MSRKTEGQGLSQVAYEWIKEAILDDRLKEGEPLSENRLAAEIQVSRTPIREALRNLEQDGFVRLVPGKGAFVAGISIEDLKEVYDIRILLEPLAARTAIDRIPSEEIEEAEARWKELQNRILRGELVTPEEINKEDRHLHEMITDYSSNNRLKQILLTLHAQIERFQLLSAESLGNPADSVAEHLEIIECLKHRDKEEIQALLAKHIQLSEDYILKKYLSS